MLLYQGAIDAVDRAAAHLAEGNMAEKGTCVLRANDIINQFLARLDYDAGGEIAQNLEGLYRFMLDQILLANANNDPKPLVTMSALLSTLRSGWEEAVIAQRKNVAQGAA